MGLRRIISNIKMVNIFFDRRFCFFCCLVLFFCLVWFCVCVCECLMNLNEICGVIA